MSLRRSVAALVILLASAACSNSAAQPRLQTTPLDPEMEIFQTSGVAAAARHLTGQISVNYRIEIFNPSGEVVNLKRLDLQTVGAGAYTVRPVTQAFDLAVESNAGGAVELWTGAYANDTILGANGPVTLRATAFFDSVAGSFRKVYVLQVNAPGRRGAH